MRAVLLDADTLGHWNHSDASKNNVNLAPIRQLFSTLDVYGFTAPSEVIERCIDADVIIINKVVIDRKIIEQLPQLKMIQLAATGMNNVDIEAAKERGIICSNVADYSTFAVAQLTLSFILNCATRTCEHHLLTQKGAWQQSRIFTLTDYPTMEVAGKRLLLLGYGSIGKKVHQLAEAFDMIVDIAHIPGRPNRKGQVELYSALEHADFVSLHCPLSEQTHQLVNQSFLLSMKPSAFLINTARGPIINEQDLATALINRTIAGACLDVLSTEPPEENNPLLHNIPNLMITPHIAWASHEAKQRLIHGIENKIIEFIGRV